MKGDSRRRQLDQSRAYAEANGLELAEGSELEDIGVSAFKGANVRDGALGVFLEAIRSGAVKPGSYLLVESLDRLTRQQLLKAQTLFLSIVEAGINLVTLADGRLYPAGTNDLGDLILSLVIMSRAHEESQIKSHRISAAWKNKRAHAGSQVPMTKWCPAWLKLADDRTRYEPIPQRVEVVRSIFKDAAAGLGIYSIATALNEAGTSTFDSPNGWHTSYIAKILSSRAVLGEFQPHVRENGKRVPTGDPSRNYYPAIIDEELFYRAQLGKSERRVKSAGRKGAHFTNLFSGLATCAYCKSPVKFENKGGGRKGGNYLICDGALRKLGCPGLRWRYRDFEASFLAFVEEIDLDSIVSANDDAAKRKKLEDELSALRGELASIAELMEKTYALLKTGGLAEFVAGKLSELTENQKSLRERLAYKEVEQRVLNVRDSQVHTSKDEIKKLVKKLQASGSHELYKLRAQISARLKGLVDRLLIAPRGALPATAGSLAQLLDMTEAEVEDLLPDPQRMAMPSDQSRRYFAVGFRDTAAMRVVFPTYSDPLQFELQIWSDRNDAVDGEGTLSARSLRQMRELRYPDTRSVRIDASVGSTADTEADAFSASGMVRVSLPPG